MKIVAATKGKRILVVEDDENLNKLISYNLSKSGYKAECVFDGITAKEKLSTDVFDIVILDIMLPGVDGFSICKWIKDDPAAYMPVVVVLTARSEPLDKIYGNQVGVDYYLTKPFSVNDLMEIIREITALKYEEFTI